MPVVRTDGRAVVYGHVIAKFSRMDSLPHFLTHGAPLLTYMFQGDPRVSQRILELVLKNSSVRYIIDCSSYFLELSSFNLTFSQFNVLLSNKGNAH